MELDTLACYRAMKTRDARFDGRFYAGITSTGIYCRPICRVRLARPENCRFFAHAAAAEEAGFRPCLRCRPELAPRASMNWSHHDATAMLAQQAAQLLGNPSAWPDGAPTIAGLVQRLGVSDRHLRRIFSTHFGVSPLQYLQTQRLLVAKQLLTDTELPVGDVAHACGFASLRRFHGAFAEHYGFSPLRLRQAHQHTQAPASSEAGSTTIRLAYRPPYDQASVLDFFKTRAIDGLELHDGARLTRTLSLDHQGRRYQGWIDAGFDAQRPVLTLRVDQALHPVLAHVIARVRTTFDLDADSEAIDEVLSAAFPGQTGARVPGTVDGFELAIRAILGQQISVAAARTLATRLVHRFGDAIGTPWPRLNRTFPRPDTLARVGADDLGQLGITRQRQMAIQALARAVCDGHLQLDGGQTPELAMATLRALPGIGEWTVQYIALRALRWPDAFPAGDVALQKALGVHRQPRAESAAQAMAQAWCPWRGYAAFRAWQALARDPSFRLQAASTPQKHR